MLFQVKLRRTAEPLQVPYPSGWSGEKSNESDPEIFVSAFPRWMTEGEILLVEQFVAKLTYPQFLDRTGAVLLDSEDPLFSATQDELDQAEMSAQQPNTRYLRDGGERSIRERVLILRERGYRGGVHKVLVAQPEEA